MAATSSSPLLGGSDAVTEDELGYFAATAAVADVCLHWPWILTVGMLNVAGGILCLVTPIVATLFAEQMIGWTVLLIGVMNISGLFFAEKKLKLVYSSLGLIQVGAGIFVLKNPYETLFAVTIWIAIMVLLDGVYQLMVCIYNRNLRGWGLALASGLSSIFLASLIMFGLPESSLYTVGILLGINMLTVGNVRIHVALEGRAIAEG